MLLPLFLGCRSTPIPATADRGRELASVRIVATGDVMMHGPVKRAADSANDVVDGVSTNHEGFDALWAGTASLVASADLAFANLETPIAPTTGNPGMDRVFNAPAMLLDSLRTTGFDLVSFANNHVYDQGREGFVETLDLLDASRLGYVGAGRTCADARRARIIDRNGLRMAFLGATDLFNQPLNGDPDQPCAAELAEDEILAEGVRARALGAEVVILSVHWGVEYEPAPTEDQVAAAHRLIEGGVDVILGHHPHVLQRIEELPASDGRIGLVVYSLGNFVSNQAAWYEPGEHDVTEGQPRDGLLLSARIVRRRHRKVVWTEIVDVVGTPLWTSNDRGDGGVAIHVDPTADRIAGLERELSNTTDPSEVERLTAELDEMARRLAEVRATVGPRWVPGPP